jgi:hypothetical protein
MALSCAILGNGLNYDITISDLESRSGGFAPIIKNSFEKRSRTQNYVYQRLRLGGDEHDNDLPVLRNCGNSG